MKEKTKYLVTIILTLVFGITGTLITLKETAKVLDGQEETLLREINIKFSRLIFNWIGSSFHEQVIKGEYNGYTDE